MRRPVSAAPVHLRLFPMCQFQATTEWTLEVDFLKPPSLVSRGGTPSGAMARMAASSRVRRAARRTTGVRRPRRFSLRARLLAGLGVLLNGFAEQLEYG